MYHEICSGYKYDSVAVCCHMVVDLEIVMYF